MDKTETAAQMQNIINMATLYKITKARAGGFRNSDITIRYADGVVIANVEKQTQLWKTHFDTIFNKESPGEVEYIPEIDEYLLVNMYPPTANEVKSAIDNIKSGKAPGADGVSAEIVESRWKRHHRNPYDVQGHVGRRRNTGRLEDRAYR